MKILCRNPLATRNGRSCSLVVFLEETADLTLFLYAFDTDLLPADVGRWRGSSHDPWTTHMIDRSTRLNNDQRRRRQILIVTRENNVVRSRLAGKQPRTTTESFVFFSTVSLSGLDISLQSTRSVVLGSRSDRRDIFSNGWVFEV